ncbi:MAG: hypothetical protein J6R79_03780 [Bacteroidaceae bacterium]|nr:hypothetical protein [Bacteroidaceae bacterium]
MFSIGFIVAMEFRQKLQPSRQVMQVVVDTTLLREGDLLLRMGEGWQSWMVAQLSGSEYSHIALAHHSSAGWMATHAVPGEQKPGEQREYLKTEPLNEYYASDRAVRGAVVRVDCSDACARGAIDFALDKVARKFEFDHQYALSDSSKYYCTELIYRAYLEQGIDFFPNREASTTAVQDQEPWLYPSAFLNHENTAWYKVWDIQPQPTE